MKTARHFNRKDIIVIGVLLALATWIWFYSGQFPNLPEGYPGPGLFPRVIALGLALIALALLVKGFISHPLTDNQQLEPDPEKSLLRLGFGAILMILFPLASPLLGFMGALLVVGVLMGLVLQVRWWKALLTASVTTAGLYLIFVKLLSVPL